VRLVGSTMLRALAALFLVTVATCFMLDLLPGTPGAEILGSQATPAQVAAFNEQAGFNDSAPSRYVHWISDLFHGDLQRSVRTNQPVLDTIRERLPVTLELALAAELLALGVAVPLGLWSAHGVGGRLDRTVTTASFGLISIAPFVLALVLVFWFSIKLGWLPVTGWVALTRDPFENLRHAALPVLTLTAAELAVYVRLMRADALATLDEPFVTYARAKGLPERTILRRHVLRPSSVSLITLAGLNLGRLIGGTVIVEQVFSLPGIGRTAVQAISSKDFYLIQGIVVVVAVSYVALNAMVDVLYGVIDPRIRRSVK
jgi:peptide/nickel transport system permease protein